MYREMLPQVPLYIERMAAPSREDRMLALSKCPRLLKIMQLEKQDPAMCTLAYEHERDTLRYAYYMTPAMLPDRRNPRSRAKLEADMHQFLQREFDHVYRRHAGRSAPPLAPELLAAVCGPENVTVVEEEASCYFALKQTLQALVMIILESSSSSSMC